MSPAVSVPDLVALWMAPVQTDVVCGGWGTDAKQRSVGVYDSHALSCSGKETRVYVSMVSVEPLHTIIQA